MMYDVGCMLICHLYVFGEVSVKVFGSFFNQVCFFNQKCLLQIFSPNLWLDFSVFVFFFFGSVFYKAEVFHFN